MHALGKMLPCGRDDPVPPRSITRPYQHSRPASPRLPLQIPAISGPAGGAGGAWHFGARCDSAEDSTPMGTFG